MRLMIHGQITTVEVIAELFSMPGSDDQFAVHQSLLCDAEEKGLFTATHVRTGFAFARGDTIDDAIEAGRAAWASRTPAEHAAAIARATALLEERRAATRSAV